MREQYVSDLSFVVAGALTGIISFICALLFSKKISIVEVCFISNENYVGIPFSFSSRVASDALSSFQLRH